MRAILAQPRGFCAGVIRAIEIVERALEVHEAPVYVLHEIVHNRHVVDELQSKGAVFVEELDDVPAGAVTIFSAHGVGRELAGQAADRGLQVIDATCPLVSKVHSQARRFDRDGRTLIIVGHSGHPEVEGHRGQVDGPVHVVGTVQEVEDLVVDEPGRVAYVTQTTLSIEDTRAVIDALEARFPDIRGPELDDICYATQNRQIAVRELARDVDVLLIVGARNSSNSNRLREVGEQSGIPSYLVEHAGEVDTTWFGGVQRIGVSAGASAPESVVQEVVQRLRELGASHVSEMDGLRETTVFSLPDVAAVG